MTFCCVPLVKLGVTDCSHSDTSLIVSSHQISSFGLPEMQTDANLCRATQTEASVSARVHLIGLQTPASSPDRLTIRNEEHLYCHVV